MKGLVLVHVHSYYLLDFHMNSLQSDRIVHEAWGTEDFLIQVEQRG